MSYKKLESAQYVVFPTNVTKYTTLLIFDTR